MKSVARLYDGVIASLAVLAAALVAFIFASIVVDVLMRMVGIQPPAWTITYVEYALLYFTMLCAPYLLRHKGHVVIESLVSVMPAPLRRFLARLTYVLCCAGALVFAYQSLLLLTDAWNSQRLDVRGVDVPMWLMFLPMPFCFLLIAVEFLRYLFGRDTLYSYDLTDAKDSI